MDSRHYWIDHAKGIGIFLVVYGHVSRGLYNAGLEVSNRLYALSDSIIYSFHMPLFFFLSGLLFFSSFKKKGALAFTFGKVDTIVYPYFVWSLIQGVLEVILSNYTNGSVTFTEVLSLLWAPRAQFWFLYALFLAVLLSVAVFSLLPAARVRSVSIILFICSALLYLYSSVLPNHLVFTYISNNYVFFAFGICFSVFSDGFNFNRRIALFASSFLFLCGQYVYHISFGFHYSDKGFWALVLAITSIVFVVVVSKCLRPNKYLLFLGAASLAIYLLHILAGSGARVIVMKVFGVSSYPLHMVVGCVVGLLCPIVVLVVVNKLKIPYVFSSSISRSKFLRS